MKNKFDSFKIILSNVTTKREEFAKDELKYFMNLCSELKYDENSDTKHNCIYIYFNTTNLNNNNTTIPQNLYSDGYNIKMCGNEVHITANSDYGIMYGVYGLLEKFFNLDILSDTVYNYNYKNYIEEEDFEVTSIPDIKIRTIGFSPLYNDNIRYCYRMRTRNMEDGWGICNHSYFKVLPPAKYKALHPDWYSQSDGGKTLCLSNKQMRLEYIEEMKKIILSHPYDKYYMIGQEDNSKFCNCNDCKKNIEKFGGASGLMLDFSIEIVNTLNKWQKEICPEHSLEFCTFAYQDTIEAPLKKVEIPENLGVMLAPLASNSSYSYFDKRNMFSMGHKYDDEKRLVTKDLIMSWHKICKKIYFWAYCSDFTNYMVPFYMWKSLQENYKNYGELKLEYIFEEGGDSIYVPNFYELKIYVLSHLMWNTKLDVKKLIEHFIKIYYGVAGEKVLEFFNYVNTNQDYLEKECNRLQLYIQFDDYPDIYTAKYWPKDFLDKSLKIINQATEIVSSIKDENENKKMFWRIHREALPIEYLAMHCHQNEYNIEQQKNMLSDIKIVADYLKVNSIGPFCGNSIEKLYRECLAEM